MPPRDFQFKVFALLLLRPTHEIQQPWLEGVGYANGPGTGSPKEAARSKNDEGGSAPKQANLIKVAFKKKLKHTLEVDDVCSDSLFM